MKTPFRSVLIANRGEIAVRIVRACREAGLRAIAVYSDADAQAMHVREADATFRIGPPPAAESYLNAASILDAARKSGAEAVHPGYGFLAERAEFAEAVQRAGFVWIGPSPDAMRLLGDKAAAKALAERVGVPTLPGYHGDAQDDDTLRSEAIRLGFPLLVKAAAGGGGRGMRLVEAEGGLEEALAAARREAKASFGDDRLLLERHVRRPRHVEMQLVCDRHGTALYLGERDCSMQRRHQKVIEEAPAPGLSAEQRRAMGEAALALARGAEYTSAGTAEFLLDEEGRFYFLEMNTRLQVEHPVTEMVTGLDLVRLQLTVAAGEPLGIRQEDVRVAGHAIECRVYAEDPAKGFLPSTGLLERLRLPDDEAGPHDGTRVDRGVREGDAVSSFYDAMIAKVIVCASDRQSVIDIMLRELSGVEVRGVQTNLDLLLSILATPAFVSGRVHTGVVDDRLVAAASTATPEVLIAAAASELLWRTTTGMVSGESTDQASPLWGHQGPWRIGGVGIEVRYARAGKAHLIRVQPPVDSSAPWTFEVAGMPVSARVRARDAPEGAAARELVLESVDGPRRFTVLRHQGRRAVRSGHRVELLDVVSGLDPDGRPASGEGAATHDVIHSPMPGRIVKLHVKPGDRVKANQTLLVLEAMKIEHLVTAPRDGVVEAVPCCEGSQVEVGTELVELED